MSEELEEMWKHCASEKERECRRCPYKENGQMHYCAWASGYNIKRALAGTAR